MKQAQVEHEQVSWVSQVNTGLQMKRAGEELVAKALRARLDKVGEKAWLQQCKDEWDWSERTAYRHLNPEGMEKDREAKRQAAETRQAAPSHKEPDEDHNLDDPTAFIEDYGAVDAPEAPLEIDVCFSHFVEAVREHSAKKYLLETQDKLAKASSRQRFSRALLAARTWIDEVLAGIEQLNHGEHK